jgi:hypothetical protein
MLIVDLTEDFSASGFEFLMTEVGTGLTFAEIALGAGDDLDKIERNTLNARKAYEAVLRFRDRVQMSEVQSEALDRKIKQLRTDLLQLGEGL